MTPLISIIVPVKNSADTLKKCLESIQVQTYLNIELIVVDNYSTDNTLEIAQLFTDQVYTKGPERSVQRNFGAAHAHGDYLLFIDSDMMLSPDIVKNCVEKVQNDPRIKAIIIPEESFGEGFWAQCKKLERSFYVGVDWMEAARFFERQAFIKAKGFNETMISGEDWDLSQRINSRHQLDRIENYIYHNEGNINFLKTIRKKYYYAQEFSKYLSAKSNHIKQAKQISILQRCWLFISQPAMLFRNPLTGLGMLFMKICEFVFGGAGYILGKVRKYG